MQLINPVEAQVRWLLKLGMAASVLTGCVALVHLTNLFSYYKLYELYKGTHSNAAQTYVTSGVILVVFSALNLIYSGLFISYLIRTKSRIASHGLEDGLASTLDKLRKLFVFQIVAVALNLVVTMYQSAQSFAAFERMSTSSQHS